MARLTIFQGLPFVEETVYANGRHLTLQQVLVDTGSAGTAFRTDVLASLGLFPQGTDEIIIMTGIGGGEAVIEKRVEAIAVGDMQVSPFTIQMGALDYSLELNGILGADFLLQAGAQINFKTLTLS